MSTDFRLGQGFSSGFGQCIDIQDAASSPSGGGGFGYRVKCRMYGSQDGLADDEIHWGFQQSQHAQINGIGEGGTKYRPGSTMNVSYHDGDCQIPAHQGTFTSGGSPDGTSNLDWPEPAKTGMGQLAQQGSGQPGPMNVEKSRYHDSPAGQTAINPWNQVENYEWGSSEKDCTSTFERHRVSHASGSMQEWGVHGGGGEQGEWGGGYRSELDTGHSTEYSKGGNLETGDHNHDEKSGGHRNQNDTGDKYFGGGEGSNDGQTKGDVHYANDGAYHQTTGGDMATACGGGMAGASVGNSTTHVGGDSKSKTDGNSTTLTSGTHTVSSKGNMAVSSRSQITMQVGSSSMTMTENDIDHTAGGGSGNYTQAGKAWTGQTQRFAMQGPKQTTMAGPATQHWALA
jgi:hypothetical protein